MCRIVVLFVVEFSELKERNVKKQCACSPVQTDGALSQRLSALLGIGRAGGAPSALLVAESACQAGQTALGTAGPVQPTAHTQLTSHTDSHTLLLSQLQGGDHSNVAAKLSTVSVNFQVSSQLAAYGF